MQSLEQQWRHWRHVHCVLCLSGGLQYTYSTRRRITSLQPSQQMMREPSLKWCTAVNQELSSDQSGSWSLHLLQFPSTQTLLQQVLHRAKSGSTPQSPGLDTYTILKQCPWLSVALADIYNACWYSAWVPEAWKVSVIRLIPKDSAEENQKEVANFHPIALTSCIGKVFTTILKNRWLAYMLLIE